MLAKMLKRGLVLTGIAALLVGATAQVKAFDDDDDKKPGWQGSIPISGKHTRKELKKLSRISASEARRTALAAVKGVKKKVVEAELEVEHGFLVYEIEVKVARQAGIDEVVVDAGNGKVLAIEHEASDDDEDERGRRGRDKDDD